LSSKTGLSPKKVRIARCLRSVACTPNFIAFSTKQRVLRLPMQL